MGKGHIPVFNFYAFNTATCHEVVTSIAPGSYCIAVVMSWWLDCFKMAEAQSERPRQQASRLVLEPPPHLNEFPFLCHYLFKDLQKSPDFYPPKPHLLSYPVA